MEWYDIGVDGEHTVKFADLPYMSLFSPTQTSPINVERADVHKLGAIIHKGEWAWLARKSILQVVSLRHGQTLSSYEFCASNGFDNFHIKCVEEIYPNNSKAMLLAVVLEKLCSPGRGGNCLVLYSIELSKVITAIELELDVTCIRFMDETLCRRSLLQNFHGCLALGSVKGVVVLLDLNIHNIQGIEDELQDITKFSPCHIVDFSLPLTDIHCHFRQCQQDDIHFGLKLEVIDNPSSVQSILHIELIKAIAIGLEDGRMAVYDLAELQIFYVALPEEEVEMSPIVKMDYLESPDDPRPCLFIWTLHENGESLYAILHNLMYEKRLIERNEESSEVENLQRYYFESFKTGKVRLFLPLELSRSFSLGCQSISTISSHNVDDSFCICALSWYSVLEKKNKLLMFDLNQWFKEDMPSELLPDQKPSYLAAYILNGQCQGVNVKLHADTIAHFNSIQRCEEHFYPNSLSFDCSLLHEGGCRRFNCEGVQDRLVNLLRVSNASIFLEPNNCFNEILRAHLMPQFTELTVNSTFSKNAKYEIILSTALENNCVSLLLDCAKSWVDGSFVGDCDVSTGLVLSTLTDWIWKRAMAIKNRCNSLCKGLFEYAGYPLDNREQKELGFITRQLKLLYDLLGDILVKTKKQIPARVYCSLKNNHNLLRMASNYQDILLWLLNIGVLPEASPHNVKVNASHDLVPYPYKHLKDIYKKKRLYFEKINENSISTKSGSCRMLFIDAFINHACKSNVLSEFWLENDGDGLYPPNSIEAMLRVMLVPELEYDDKYAILLYFFLDLNMAIDEEAYKSVVANFIKFPSVFNLSAGLIKMVQSFWNLDHDEFLAAVDEFISPFNKIQAYPQWMVELLIESLLIQNAGNLALRILESQPSLISPVLKLKTLLANELIAEAFHFVRSKSDDNLLEMFFSFCLSKGQFGVIRDLALNEHEGTILQNILKRSKAPGAESLHFIYLLQKCKYIEAISYLDELSTKSKSYKQQPNCMDTPNMVLSAYNTTLTPVTQGLTDVYFRIKDKIKKKEFDNNSPVPLSCQLVKQNANSLLGGIYHSSALSAHFATYYWGELDDQKDSKETNLLSSNNAPFLRRPQMEAGYVDYSSSNNLSFPLPYKAPHKRTLAESELLENAEERLDRHRMENPKKKRRLLGQEFLNDMTHFMKKNQQNSINLNAKNFSFNEQLSVEGGGVESAPFMEMLTRPMMPAQYNTSVPLSTTTREIHGILKTHTPDSQCHSEREEKYLRFSIPSTDLNISEKNEAEERDEPEEMVAYDDEMPTTSAKALKALTQSTRASSLESGASAGSLYNSSDDNFYSPSCSQNNSKFDVSNTSRNSLLFGPKARKPLARLSAEKEETCRQSLSIEKEQSRHSLSSGSAEEKQEQRSKSKSKECSPAVSFKNISENITDMTQNSSNMEYTTAVGATALNIFTQKPLQKAVDMDTMEFNRCENRTMYVTAHSTQPSVTVVKSSVEQISSGIGTISARSTLTGSKITEFIPKLSSSKVGGTSPNPNVQQEEKRPSPAKISECSTVLGSFDFTSSGTNYTLAGPTVPVEKSNALKPTEEQKKQMLETTLGMSSYDITMLDSTSLQPMKSNVIETAIHEEAAQGTSAKDENINVDLEPMTIPECNEVNMKDSPKHDEPKNVDKIYVLESIKENMEVSADEGDDKIASDLSEPETDDVININQSHMQISERGIKLKADSDDSETEKEKPHVWGDLLNSSDDDCVVLSSASSIIDDNDYGFPFEIRTSDESGSESGGNANDNESEKSFDTGEYDDYEDAITNTDDATTNTDGNTAGFEDESTGTFDKHQRFSDSNDIMELNDYFSEVDNTNTNSMTYITSQNRENVDVSNNEIEIPSSPSVVETSSETNARTDECVAISSIDIGKKNDSFLPIDNEQFTLKIEEGDSADSTDLMETCNAENTEESVHKDVDIAAANKAEEVVEAEIVFSSSRRTRRGSSVPLLELNVKENLIESPRRNIRGSSIPALPTGSLSSKQSVVRTSVSSLDDEKKNIAKGVQMTPIVEDCSTGDKKEGSNDQSVREASVSSLDKENEVALRVDLTCTPKRITEPTSRSVTETSVSSFDKEHEVASPRKNIVGDISDSQDSIKTPKHKSVHRHIRGSSVSALDKELLLVSPHRNIRRSRRASSLQPEYRTEEETTSGLKRTPTRKEKSEGDTIFTETSSRIARGSPVTIGKILQRRCSALLEAIDENSTTPKSRSANTRSKSRLSSIDSEADTSSVSSEPIVKKRGRTTSVSETSVLPTTPKRSRRSSLTLQPETSGVVLTPRTLRSRSVLSLADEKEYSITSSPKPKKEARTVGKKHIPSVNDLTHSDKDDKESDNETETLNKSNESTKEDSSSYTSSSRRMTRTQLAIMEKSVALLKSSKADPLSKGSESPTSSSKRLGRIRSTRSSVHESDDTESISSKLSTTSSAATSSKRRVTRQSVKDKGDDDDISITSSVGSEHASKSYRSKERGSPALNTLSVIPEDAPIQTSKRGRKKTKN